MDRLTQKDQFETRRDGEETYCLLVEAFNGLGEGILTVTALPPPLGYRVKGIAVEFLAAYESTGLTPEEVNKLRADLACVTAERDAAVADMTVMSNIMRAGELCRFCKFAVDERCSLDNREEPCFEWRGAKEATHENQNT